MVNHSELRAYVDTAAWGGGLTDDDAERDEEDDAMTPDPAWMDRPPLPDWDIPWTEEDGATARACVDANVPLGPSAVAKLLAALEAAEGRAADAEKRAATGWEWWERAAKLRDEWEGRAVAAEAAQAAAEDVAAVLDRRVTTLRAMLAEAGVSDADVQLGAAYRDAQAGAS